MNKAIIREPYLTQIDFEREFRSQFLFKFVDSNIKLDTFKLRFGQLYEYSQFLNDLSKTHYIFKEVSIGLYYELDTEQFDLIKNKDIHLYNMDNPQFTIELTNNDLNKGVL